MGKKEERRVEAQQRQGSDRWPMDNAFANRHYLKLGFCLPSKAGRQGPILRFQLDAQLIG